MAKHKPIAFKHTNTTGDVLEFKAEATVTQDGWFALTVPEELAQSAQALAKQLPWKGTVVVEKAKINWRVTGQALAQVQSFIEAALADHLSKPSRRHPSIGGKPSWKASRM